MGGEGGERESANRTKCLRFGLGQDKAWDLPLVSGFVPSNTTLENFGSIPHLKLSSEKKFSSFANYARERHPAYPTPWSDEFESSQQGQWGWVDAFRGRENPGNNLDVIFGGMKFDEVIYRSFSGQGGVERVMSAQCIRAFSWVEWRDVEIFRPFDDEFYGRLDFCVWVGSCVAFCQLWYVVRVRGCKIKIRCLEKVYSSLVRRVVYFQNHGFELFSLIV